MNRLSHLLLSSFFSLAIGCSSNDKNNSYKLVDPWEKISIKEVVKNPDVYLNKQIEIEGDVFYEGHIVRAGHYSEDINMSGEFVLPGNCWEKIGVRDSNYYFSFVVYSHSSKENHPGEHSFETAMRSINGQRLALHLVYKKSQFEGHPLYWNVMGYTPQEFFKK